MSWSAPPTAVTGAIITAAFWNTGGRDNLNDLDRRTSPTGSVVATSQTTTATSYTDLATVGPAVTVTIGSTGKALISMHSAIANATSALASYFGVAISGATVLAASDATAIGFTSPSSGAGIRAGTIILVTGLSAGSTTFTSKYRMDPGVGPATFVDRRLSVTPLGS